MSGRVFELSVEIGASTAKLHAFLLDLHAHAPLHPLIESIEEIEPRAPLPGATWYRVVDRVPVGPVHMRAIYTAALQDVSPVEVHGHAWQTPGVRLHTVYRLSELAGDRTRLDESCSVRAPWGLRGFVTRQARAAHATTHTRLKALFEGDDA